MMKPKDMSAEELVRICVIGFCCYTPAECEEIEAELLSRIKDGERAVKVMDELNKLRFRDIALEEFADRTIDIIDQWRNGNE